MENEDYVGTALPTIARLRDVVRPMAVRMINSQTRPYADLLVEADRDELTGRLLEKYMAGWKRGEGEVDREVYAAVNEIPKGYKEGDEIPEDHRNARLGSWMKKAAKGVVIDELRRRGVRKEQLADMAASTNVDSRLRAALGEMATPSLITHHKMLLLDALEQVSKKDRDLIQLRYEAGLSVTEIADRVGVDYETVKRRLQRATQRLRAAIEAIDPTFAIPKEKRG